MIQYRDSVVVGHNGAAPPDGEKSSHWVTRPFHEGAVGRNTQEGCAPGGPTGTHIDFFKSRLTVTGSDPSWPNGFKQALTA
jgi:hypothetical protein